MIYIKKNQTNKVILTLSESSNIQSPNYLFVFENEYRLEDEPIYWTSQDKSGHTNRFNEFELVESSTGSTTGGTSSLNLIAGQYKYSIYESNTVNPQTIENTSGRIIETGRMVVEISNITNEINNNNNILDNIYL
jgi:hypothetical protein